MKIATSLAIEAAEKICEAIDNSSKQFELKSVANIVTSTDKNNEKLIFDCLRKRFPSHTFIGEEETEASGGLEKIAGLTDNPTWIVDLSSWNLIMLCFYWFSSE
eukprot:c20227_g1_i4.p1 GENE.c20227_g1_i4~~c20227_g1_i4.p1  ORF type:complete len:104 (+),score=35.35 c20227_g1_i4:75-386(+)